MHVFAASFTRTSISFAIVRRNRTSDRVETSTEPAPWKKPLIELINPRFHEDSAPKCILNPLPNRYCLSNNFSFGSVRLSSGNYFNDFCLPNWISSSLCHDITSYLVTPNQFDLRLISFAVCFHHVSLIQRASSRTDGNEETTRVGKRVRDTTTSRGERETREDRGCGTFSLAIVGWTARWKHNTFQPAQVYTGASRLALERKGGLLVPRGLFSTDTLIFAWPSDRYCPTFNTRN